MIKTKTFQSSLLSPLSPTPDGSSLEELVNAFLATLDPKDVLDVLKESTSTGKYGLTTSHFGTVVYRA
jgi:hypothetical protein